MAESSGPIVLKGVTTLDLGVPGATQDLKQTIAKAQKDPLTAWMTPLLNHPNLRLSVAVDEFDEWKYRSQGLNVGGAVLISLAVVLATGGAAAGLTQSVITFLGGGLGASMAGAGASAGFQTLLTQAGISLANNQGNIGKTLKDLGSSTSILGLVTAAGTAGLTYGLSKQLGVSQAGTSIGDHLQRSAVQTGVSTGFSIIIQDQNLGDALLQGIINVAANTAGGLGANSIGDLRDKGSIDGITHKALHGLLGAVLGAASNLEDPGKGALGGAIGAASGELVAENLPGCHHA